VNKIICLGGIGFILLIGGGLVIKCLINGQLEGALAAAVIIVVGIGGIVTVAID